MDLTCIPEMKDVLLLSMLSSTIFNRLKYPSGQVIVICETKLSDVKKYLKLKLEIAYSVVKLNLK